MSHPSIPPLDLQTEHLDRNQYPSVRLLLVVAAVICSMLLLTWASHREGLAEREEIAASPEKQERVARELISRAIPLRP